MNAEIVAEKIRLIDEDGEQKGVMTPAEAMVFAQAAGLDLIEIAPQADPPVCKILDYGKYKYEQQKKAAEARKKQKVIEVKEIKIRPTIDDHDFETKMKAAKGFLEEGDKVKITMRLRGREGANKAMLDDVLNRVKAELDAAGKVEMEPRLEGRQITMVIAAK
ncbi:MAG: translation initiation factor IF-3 [Alphaproteobacteria bacterium]|nr:translation initiation factor IF-3 [Alphaproteobacteria bacterium]